MKWLKTGLAMSSRQESGLQDGAAQFSTRWRIAAAMLAAASALTLGGCSHADDHAAMSAGGGTGTVAGIGSAQKITFLRKYTVGDKDAYAATVVMGKSMDSAMTETQAVTKVYDDGTADISVTMSDMKMKLNCKDTPIPAGAMAPITMHYDKYGSPMESKDSGGGVGAMPFSLSDTSVVRDGISVGQTVSFDTPVKNKISSKGTVTFVGITDGAAQLHVVSDSTSDGKPSGHVDGMMFMDMSTSKLSKADLTMGAPGGESTHMTMTRKAS